MEFTRSSADRIRVPCKVTYKCEAFLVVTVTEEHNVIPATAGMGCRVWVGAMAGAWRFILAFMPAYCVA